MAGPRWTFYDPEMSATYSFEINPNSGGSPDFKRNFTYQNTAGAFGKTLIFEGRGEPQKMELSGTLLTQAQYDAFVTWYLKRNQILMTDDLGRQFWVVIEEFKPTRVRSVQHPWKHTYTISVTVVNWP
jgi:hypothetical protein